MTRAVTILATSLLLFPALAEAQQRDAGLPVIAVIDFGTSTVTPGTDVTDVGSALASMLTSELANRPGIRVVDRQDIEELIRQHQLSATGRVDDERARQFARSLGADYLIYGTVFLQGREARLDLQLRDAWSSEVIKSDKRRGSRDDFLRMVERIADNFSTDVPAPDRAVAAIAPPPPAVLAYSRGLNYERRRMTARAAEMFRTALELFPEYEAAATALARVDRGGRR
jgi:TolB-like protein